MDADRFDRLSKAFFCAGTRRRLIGLLTTAPVLASLTVLLSSEESEAEHPANRVLDHKAQRRHKARQERRKKRNQRQQDQNQNSNDGGGGGAPGATGETCVPLDQVCGGPFVTCCGGRDHRCHFTAAIVVETCQAPCLEPGIPTPLSPRYCQDVFGWEDVSCVHDTAACFGTYLSTCCRPNQCSRTKPCKSGGACCATLAGDERCCAPGQTCSVLGGCRW